MEQRVRVCSVGEDGTAQVVHVRPSACSGDCYQCAGCGAARETLALTVKDPIGAKPGDLVTIRSETAPVLGAAAVLYLLPLALFIAGYLLWGPLAGGLAFAAGIGAAVVYDRAVARKKKVVYTITGLADDPTAPEKRG